MNEKETLSNKIREWMGYKEKMINVEDVKEFLEQEGKLCWKLYKKEIDFGKFWAERIELIGKKLLEEKE